MKTLNEKTTSVSQEVEMAKEHTTKGHIGSGFSFCPQYSMKQSHMTDTIQSTTNQEAIL